MSIRFKLSPELGDGEHYTVVDTPAQLCEAVKAWAECEEFHELGEGFHVEVIEMSQEEVDALPET